MAGFVIDISQKSGRVDFFAKTINADRRPNAGVE